MTPGWWGARLLDGFLETRLRRRIGKMTEDQCLNWLSECGQRLQDMTHALYDGLELSVLAEGRRALTGFAGVWVELEQRATTGSS